MPRNRSDFQPYSNHANALTRSAGRQASSWERRIESNKRLSKVLLSFMWFGIISGWVAWAIRYAL